MDSSTSPLVVSTETALELLANPRRRRILSYLSETPDGTASFDDVADRVAAAPPTDGDGPAPGPSVEVDLHHVQLPRLGRAGVVEYDPVTGTVRYTPDERLEKLLEVVAE